ncbi:hypothetical protein ACWEK5_42175, partial [Rhodococcus koreensis]
MSERISLRMHRPEQPGVRSASWAARYQLWADIDAGWADAWLHITRAALSVAGCRPDRTGHAATRSVDGRQHPERVMTGRTVGIRGTEVVLAVRTSG